MEPLRKCRTAKFFSRVPGNPAMWQPVVADPPCSYCPMELAGRPVPAKTECSNCHCRRMSLYDLAQHELKVPDIDMNDFVNVLGRTKPTVATRELERFEEFTKEFGSEGS